ncbi:MAG: glycosyltransferase family 4 protein [Actinobacteria bacterium]|nr:glycosyltransferase family 4 protein [Actinomycetota bacterium]
MVDAGASGAGSERLRIAMVALNYAPSVGGAQEHVRRVAEGLAARGHAVEVITTDALRSPSGADPGRIDPLHDRLADVTVQRHRVSAWLRRVQRAVRWVSVQLPGRPPDVADVVLHPLLAGPYAPSMAGAVRSARRRCDVVLAWSAPFLTLVGPLRRRRAAAAVVAVPLVHAQRRGPHRVVARALRRADGVVASTSYERDLQLAMGVELARTVVLPPGTDLDRFPDVDPAVARARLGLPERPTVGYVGRLAAYKGVDTLLDAAPQLWASHPELTVLVAGSTTGWVGHRRAADQLGDDRVAIREDVSPEEVALALSACDVVALPSRDESFGLVIAEAWAARRAVVAADIPVVHDVVRPGIDAVLVPPGDQGALAVAVAGLLEDPERRHALAAAGRRRVEDDLQWPAIIDGWERFLGDRRAQHLRAGAA